MSETDDNFFNRADEHIHLSNDQMQEASMGKVSASMMYSVARFNAYVSACSFKSAEELRSSKQEMINYFLPEYEKMLSENLDDYIENFEAYFGG